MLARTLFTGIAVAIVTPLLVFGQAFPPRTINKVVLAGTRTVIFGVADLNPDCTLFGPTKIRISEDARHGKSEIVDEPGFVTYAAANARSACSKHQVPMTKIYYTGNADYDGTDTLDVNVFFPNGASRDDTFNIVVKKEP